jgi:hypothetical protein
LRIILGLTGIALSFTMLGRIAARFVKCSGVVVPTEISFKEESPLKYLKDSSVSRIDSFSRGRGDDVEDARIERVK